MELLSALLQSSQRGAVQSAASQFGLDGASTDSLLNKLVPALAGGIKRNAASGDGLAALTSALASGNHQRFLDDPTALQEQSTVAEGNSILGHLFGSKEVSRQVAANAAQETGIDAAVVKRFLPVAAAAAMGALSKETGAGTKLAQGAQAGGAGLLGRLLDSDGDGSVVDNLLSLGKRLF